MVFGVEKVGQKIAEWYSCIITKDLIHSRSLKLEVNYMIEKMEPDDKMLAYYQLVSLRHDLLVLRESPDESNVNLDETILDNIAKQSSDYLKFMYYYVWGQTEFHNKRYKSAIRTYKIAERLIEKVKDPAEKAEFHQKLGISYYQIDQYTFAFSYIEQALEFFEKDSSYALNVIACKLTLAGIYSEITEFDKAEEIYKELLLLAKPLHYSYALIHYNMGMNRIIRGDYHRALNYLNQALQVKEFQISSHQLKTKYYILNLKMRQGISDDGLVELEKEVHNKDAVDLVAKLKISRGLYLENDHSLVVEGLRILEENEYFHDCHDMGGEISKHFKEKKEFERAFFYLNYSVDMSKRKITLGDDQS